MQSMLCGFDMNTLFKFLAFFGGFLIFWNSLVSMDPIRRGIYAHTL